MHLRALDYILKPIDLDAMNRILTNAVSPLPAVPPRQASDGHTAAAQYGGPGGGGPEGIVLNELDLEPDSWCCFPAGGAGRSQLKQAVRRHPLCVRAQVFGPEPDSV